ncbi:hypothetical protein [Sciscionella sediminilitoris]|uniref:hypothetical protein n=1 Tax=Sciscionella sediminilitoris TaxID=1445613 RepID=UPI0012E1D2C1|nr:hypothetical protein [Sciscionella sp. SE31]
MTTLIGDGLRKKPLESWGIRTVAEYVADHLDEVYAMRGMGREAIVSALKQSPYSDRDAAARRGTEVHKLAEALAAGVEIEVPEERPGMWSRMCGSWMSGRRNRCCSRPRWHRGSGRIAARSMRCSICRTVSG